MVLHVFMLKCGFLSFCVFRGGFRALCSLGDRWHSLTSRPRLSGFRLLPACTRLAKITPLVVIPACAGMYCINHWIPAFAGMTGCWFYALLPFRPCLLLTGRNNRFLASHFVVIPACLLQAGECRNPLISRPRLSGFRLSPACTRLAEIAPLIVIPAHAGMYCINPWIPAFAGMTGCWFYALLLFRPCLLLTSAALPLTSCRRAFTGMMARALFLLLRHSGLL